MSIMFLKPKMKIILRKRKVQCKFVAKSLSHTEKDVYKPTWLVSLSCSRRFHHKPPAAKMLNSTSFTQCGIPSV